MSNDFPRSAPAARSNEASLKVSIIIPAYNASAYVREALESVFAQTYRNFEAIVVNDGSPDTSELERVIRPYSGDIVYIKQENRGLAGARNSGIAAASGDLLAFLDADDAWFPEFLERQAAHFERRPELDMLWCDGVLFGDPSVEGRRNMELSPCTRPVDVHTLLAQRAVPLTSCVVVRRKAVLEAGGFDERFRRAEDFDLYLRLAYSGKKLDFHTEALGRRRISPGSLSADTAAQCLAAIEVAEKFRMQVGHDERLQRAIDAFIRRLERDLHMHRARKHLTAGEYAAAAAELRLVNQNDKTLRLSLLIPLLERSPRLAALLLDWRRRAVRAGNQRAAGSSSPRNQSSSISRDQSQ